MTLKQMADWIANSAPKQSQIYHKGFFALDALISADLRRLRNLLLLAEHKALVELTQKKIAEGEFEYIVSRTKRKWPYTSSDLIAECAKRDMLKERAEGV